MSNSTTRANRGAALLVAMFAAAGSIPVSAAQSQDTAAALPSLVDADPEVRLHAVWALSAAAGDASGPAALSGVALFDIDPEIRAEALLGLAQLGGDLFLPTVSQALFDAETGVRAVAIDTLGAEGSEAAIELLAVALTDEDPRRREDVVYALARSGGGDRARSLLLAAALDLAAAVREAAVLVVRELSRAGLEVETDPE